jgi:hypothetical protein
MNRTDFRKDLNFSHKDAKAPYWKKNIYSVFEPILGKLIDTEMVTDKGLQDKGIDRIAYYEHGHIYGEEKVRRPAQNGTIYYTDILLEELSTRLDARGFQTPGWIAKPTLADFIIYSNPPAEFAVIMAADRAQAAWFENQAEWKRRFPQKLVNPRFCSQPNKPVNWAIPWEIWFAAMRYGYLWVPLPHAS